jgi:hypothetical protein
MGDPVNGWDKVVVITCHVLTASPQSRRGTEQPLLFAICLRIRSARVQWPSSSISDDSPPLSINHNGYIRQNEVAAGRRQHITRPLLGSNDGIDVCDVVWVIYLDLACREV